MAMLAEPRRKLKVVNLRGTSAWSKDNNKFGQRMLERMGWAPGKGLGAREDGVTAHVVARYKNDDHGLGYNDRNDQWTQHEDSFESLLAGLRSEAPAETPEHVPSSLEQKSKKSRARVHYHKFTRGKDLSRYSEKDLANIFGKKSLKNREARSKKSTIQQINSAYEIQLKSECKELEIKGEQQPQQVFKCGGNMADYFTSKLRALGRSELSTTVSSSFEVSEQITLQDLTQKEYDQDNLHDLPCKKKKNKNGTEGDNLQNSVDVVPEREVAKTENYEIINKKNKKKMCDTGKNVENSRSGSSPFGVNEQITLQDLTRKDCDQDNWHDLSRKKKKKKNRTEGENFQNSVDVFSELEVAETENNDNITNKKNRKKMCDAEKHFENSTNVSSPFEINEQMSMQDFTEKEHYQDNLHDQTQKKKKKKNRTQMCDNEKHLENSVKNECGPVDCGDMENKKKKNKSKVLEQLVPWMDVVMQDEPKEAISNIDCESLTISEPLHFEDSAKKAKKNKRKVDHEQVKDQNPSKKKKSKHKNIC